MRTTPPVTRRSLLQVAVAGAGLLAVGARAAAPLRQVSASQLGVDPELCQRALQALADHSRAIRANDIIAIADFGKASAAPRFHLVDLIRGETTTLLVAHGLGSDPDNLGFLQAFSNQFGSNATSEGAFVTDELYVGIHGLSRRIDGLEQSNFNARPRDIVIHAAPYVSQDVAVHNGKVGRSNGCFAFAGCDIGQVLARLGRGRLLYAGRSGNVTI